MIIKSLELNNFRQFVGKQTIYFSTDPEKKITLVIAESGVGKTTLIQSFQWIFYGQCKYKTPLNDAIKNELRPYQETKVSCSLKLMHKDKEYIVTREQKMTKINVQIQVDPSYITIDEKDASGITTQYKGREADKIIRELMHQDLFPYFFLEGESLTKVGEQMSRGKSGANNEFVKAIKGLLGFNHLYEATKHLDIIAKNYQTEIAQNSNDARLKQIVNEIGVAEDTIRKCQERLDLIPGEIQYNSDKAEELHESIIRYGEVEKAQRRTKVLEGELLSYRGKINDQKKYIFKKFSSLGFNVVMDGLLDIARDTLANADSMDRGIPGMNVEAIEYLLERHQCLCGHKLEEGSKEWQELEKWKTYLPPNNIGFEIERFTSQMEDVDKNSDEFINDYDKARKDLNALVGEYQKRVDELNKLNEDIGGVNQDIGKLKEEEQRYRKAVIDLNIEKRQKEEKKANAEKDRDRLIKEQNGYGFLSEKVAKLNCYFRETEYLKNRIIRFTNRKEKEKREALQDAINEIFRDFYDEKILFTLDSNYGVQIKTSDSDFSDDFTSGGQDVAVALAFIGAIIKLNREKDADPENMIDDDDSEEYPLVMDAPTSNFGMKQMDSFSEIMPKITDQIVVFINDKDGPILRRKMAPLIGKEWTVSKEDSYHSIIEEA